MKRLFAVLFAFVIGAWVWAADAATGSMRLTWTLPTTGCSQGVTPCDNAPLTGDAALTAVEVYISTSSIADTSTMAPTLTLTAGATTTTHTMTVPNGSTMYARIKVVNTAGKSTFSPQVSKPVKLPVTPGVATEVTFEITVTP